MKASISSVNAPFDSLNSDKHFSNISNVQGLKQLWENALKLFGNGEPLRISEKRDRHGKTYWEVYDAIAEEHATFGSEAEVRVWIEQRYAR